MHPCHEAHVLTYVLAPEATRNKKDPKRHILHQSGITYCGRRPFAYSKDELKPVCLMCLNRPMSLLSSSAPPAAESSPEALRWGKGP